ncbi:MAG: Dna2/Cas4 domain-containing protein [Candidatus Woesearchaeota archaeon]
MVTATQLSSYLYCPRKLFMNTILLVEEPPKRELVKGKIWHETYESINNAEGRIVSSIKTKNYQDILDIYRKNYSKSLRDVIINHKTELKEFNIPMIEIFTEYWPSFEEEAKGHALNVSRFIDNYNIYGLELWGKLTPKIFCEQYFKSDRLNLSGVVDVLEVHEIVGKKIYVPVELKTGKVPDKGIWEGHRIQLGAYILLLEDLGKSVTEGVLRYKGAEGRVLQMNSFLKDEILILINKTNSLLKNLTLPDIIDNKNKCKTCPLKVTCYNHEAMKKLLEETKSRFNKS